jgi:hypothetical protein
MLMVTYSKFILPPRSHHWHDIVPPPLPTSSEAQSSEAQSSFLTDALFITVPAQKTTRCVVNKNNRDSWTKTHREKAGHRVIAKSVEHLQELVCTLLL